MKAALTMTSFCLGDETPLYESTNHEAMSTVARNSPREGEAAERATANNDLKAAIKKSSIHFGQEKVNYESVAHESMQYRGNQSTFDKMRDDIKEMTVTLRKHNFSFGDESVEYKSDYQRGYGSLPLSAYAVAGNQRPVIRETINEQRRSHFSFGLEKVNYLSNTHAALKIIEGHPPGDMSKGLENARAMKEALQRTSIVIGDDQEYM